MIEAALILSILLSPPLIPIFGIVLGYIFLNEIITSKVIVAVAAVVLGIYFVRRSIKKKIT